MEEEIKKTEIILITGRILNGILLINVFKK
jgi:hypothetical protein